jgi:tripartite-type tricarboxylate transporter receptor subunit TctC
MSQSMGVPVIVENRPGAGGNLGAALVAKGEASGHTLLMAPSAILATNQWLYQDLQYDPQKDFVPVTNAATTPNLMVVHPSLPALRSGRLKAVALTAMKRHPQAPEVPTANESGLPGFEVNVWYGFAVHSATPKPVVQKLDAEIVKALRDAKISERLEQLGLAIVADSPEEFAKFVALESDKMRKLVQASGARVD